MLPWFNQRNALTHAAQSCSCTSAWKPEQHRNKERWLGKDSTSGSTVVLRWCRDALSSLPLSTTFTLFHCTFYTWVRGHVRGENTRKSITRYPIAVLRWGSYHYRSFSKTNILQEYNYLSFLHAFILAALSFQRVYNYWSLTSLSPISRFNDHIFNIWFTYIYIYTFHTGRVYLMCCFKEVLKDVEGYCISCNFIKRALLVL